MFLLQEIIPIHEYLALVENNQQQFNRFWEIYQVKTSQVNATGSVSLHTAETITLSEQIFKKIYLYSIKSDTTRQ